MAQLHRSDRDTLDGALGVYSIDVFAGPEGIIDQEEEPGEDVAYQGLGAETDSKAEDPAASEIATRPAARMVVRFMFIFPVSVISRGTRPAETFNYRHGHSTMPMLRFNAQNLNLNPRPAPAS